MQDGTLSAEILSLQKLKAELEELKKASMYHVGDVMNIEKMFLRGTNKGKRFTYSYK